MDSQLLSLVIPIISGGIGGIMMIMDVALSLSISISEAADGDSLRQITNQ